MRLRAQSDHDVEDVVRACQDPEISRWTLIPSPYTKEDALKWFAVAQSERDSGGAFHLLIVDAVDEDLLGAIGVDLRSDEQHTYGDVGYWLAAAARGQGYATRALELLTSWTLDSLDVEWLQLVIDPRNHSSRRVAERAGCRFVKRGPTTFRGKVLQFDHFRIDRSERPA